METFAQAEAAIRTVQGAFVGATPKADIKSRTRVPEGCELEIWATVNDGHEEEPMWEFVHVTTAYPGDRVYSVLKRYSLDPDEVSYWGNLL